MNEYEMLRTADDGTPFTVHPEYRLPITKVECQPGEERTSDRTERVESFEQISALLDRMGRVEFCT